MRQADAEFVEVEHADAHEDGDAEVLAVAREADFAADIVAEGLGFDLFQGGVGRACGCARADVVVGDETLSLCGDDGSFDDLDDGADEFAAKIDGGGANAALGELAFYIRFLAAAGGGGKLYGGAPDVKAGIL